MLMRSKELCKTVSSLERLGTTKRARGGWEVANGIAQPDAFTEKNTVAMHSQAFQAILCWTPHQHVVTFLIEKAA